MAIILVILGMVLGAWLLEAGYFGLLAGGLLGWLLARSIAQDGQLRELQRRISQQEQLANAVNVPLPNAAADGGKSATSSAPLASSSEIRADELIEQPEDLEFIDMLAHAQSPVDEMPAYPEITEALPAHPQPGTESATAARRKESQVSDGESGVVAWISEWFTEGNLLVRGGSVILFFGVAFLFKYAVEHAFLPVWVRMCGVGLAAVVMMGIGYRLRERRAAYALGLQGGGLGLLYLTVYASYRLYDLLPAVAALSLLAAIAAGGVAMAIFYNARWLAVISFAGGFLAPLLASTGSGNHVGLFSWYMVLNIGIAILAYYRSWRELSRMGLGATFIISAMWGWNYYRPELFYSVEPFLIGFGLLYLLIGMMFTFQQHVAGEGVSARVDASLIFGAPVGFFILQAPLVEGMAHGLSLSTFIGGLLYLGVAFVAWKRGHKYLTQSLLAIAVTLLTLTIPLEFDESETAAFWAMEGVGLLWLGLVQRSSLSTYTGLGLQFLAAISWLAGSPLHPDAGYGTTLSGLLISLSAWGCAVLIRRLDSDGLGAGNTGLFFQFWGLAWWLGVGCNELNHHLDGRDLLLAAMALFGASAWLVEWMSAYFQWQRFRYFNAALFGLWIVALAMDHLLETAHPLSGWGWVVWPAVVASAVALLRPLVNEEIAWSHLTMPVFYLMFATWEFHWLVTDLLAFAEDSIWGRSPVAWAAVLGLLGLLAGYRVWPEPRFPHIWVKYVPAMLFSVLAVWALAMLRYPVDMSPLPYMPLLNPVDLICLVAVIFAYAWWQQLQKAGLGFFEATHFYIAAAAFVFVQLNADMARIAHHWFGIAWHERAITRSIEFQAMVSICWSLLALALMFGGNRKSMRTAWMGGAILLAGVAVKLFLVDLSGSGTLARIVSFLAVGILMLVIGYVAPVPPAGKAREEEVSNETA